MGPGETLKETQNYPPSHRPVLGRTGKGLPLRFGRESKRASHYRMWELALQDEQTLKAAADRVRPTFSRSHSYARARVGRELDLSGGNAKGLAQLWYERKAPSTAAHYIRTLSAMRPDLRSEMQVTLTEARKEATVLAAKRAKAASPRDVKRIMEGNPTIAVTVLAMWVSASRHADLLQITRMTKFPLTVMVQWSRMKSDRFGQRAVTKCLYWDQPWPKEWAPYRSVLNGIKKTCPELTVHSLRRGAVSWLSQQGHSFSEIAALTAHTPSADPNVAVRRYADPHPSQPEAQTQRSMSKALWDSVQI